jgi:hypothetical protein
LKFVPSQELVGRTGSDVVPGQSSEVVEEVREPARRAGSGRAEAAGEDGAEAMVIAAS